MFMQMSTLDTSMKDQFFIRYSVYDYPHKKITELKIKLRVRNSTLNSRTRLCSTIPFPVKRIE